jgi:hypothetical protein
LSNRETKKFHFQEIGKIIEFPTIGNQGKYFQYQVNIKSKDTANKPGKTALLGEFLESTEVENNYPHTIGYYKESEGEGAKFNPEYLVLRKICTIEEFWVLLNASNL